jgi:hypothetical protein
MEIKLFGLLLKKNLRLKCTIGPRENNLKNSTTSNFLYWLSDCYQINENEEHPEPRPELS